MDGGGNSLKKRAHPERVKREKAQDPGQPNGGETLATSTLTLKIYKRALYPRINRNRLHREEKEAFWGGVRGSRERGTASAERGPSHRRRFS